MILRYFFLLFLSVSVTADEATPLSQACTDFVNVDDSSTPYVWNSPYKQGVLWKVEKDGKVNYVYGTIHSQDYTVTKFPPEVRLALIKSKVLYMESIPGEESNQAFLNSVYFKDGTKLDTLIDKPFYNYLADVAKDYGIPPENLNDVKPWAAYTVIGRPKPVRAATLEMNLLGFARRIQIQVDTLETMDEIINSLESVSMADQIIILKDTICNHTKIIQDTKKLVALYFNRNLEGIVQFNHQPHYDEAIFERFMQSVMYSRNDRMIERMDKFFSEGGAFVAVGTSHLTEERGLLDRLAAKGYTLTSLY